MNQQANCVMGIINFLDRFFPSLLKIPDFLLEFITPIVKVHELFKSTNKQSLRSNIIFVNFLLV
jgi:hypothetical protein